MSSVAEIEKAVAELPPEEFAAFRAWFERLDSERFDQRIAQDAASGRLDFLANEAALRGRCHGRNLVDVVLSKQIGDEVTLLLSIRLSDRLSERRAADFYLGRTQDKDYRAQARIDGLSDSPLTGYVRMPALRRNVIGTVVSELAFFVTKMPSSVFENRRLGYLVTLDLERVESIPDDITALLGGLQPSPVGA